MIERVLRIWRSRSDRDRTAIAVLAFLLAAGMYAWLWQAAGPARTQLRESILKSRAQAARLEQHASEYDRLKAKPAPAVTRTDLRTLLATRIAQSGLSRELVRIDAADANQVGVVFGSLSFAEWLAWVANLQTLNIRLIECRIESLSAPGLVSVNATFARTTQ